MSKLAKYTVCTSCLSVGIEDLNCICRYRNHYATIELEFETCECCGSISNQPADTEFNTNQFKNKKDE